MRQLTTIRRLLTLPVLASTMGGCDPEAALLPELLPVSRTRGGLTVEWELGRPFANHDGRTLRMDVFRPRDLLEPVPVVILIHGGFWLYGERSYMYDWAADLAQEGYAAVSIDYRLIPENGVYPEPVRDVLAALAHLREHDGELQLNPSRIALFGVSAGAHLALMVGMAPEVRLFDPAWPEHESAGVRAVVDIYGPTDFTADPASVEFWQEQLVTCFLGDTRRNEALWREASPVTYARAEGPAVLILHGSLDPIVPIGQAYALRDALQAAGQSHGFIELSDVGHFWGSWWAGAPVQNHRTEILEFLKAHL